MARRTVLTGLSALATVTLTGCMGGTPQRRQIRIATGSRTAVYFAVGSALAAIIEQELPETDADAIVTAASAENVQLITNSKAEIGFTQADILVSGTTPDPRIAALARVYDDLLHLVVRADSPIRSLEHLRGKRVSVGARGSGTGFTVKRLLTVAGLVGPGILTQVEINLDDSLKALAVGEIDAFFFSGGLPVSGIKQLAGKRIVDLSKSVTAMRKQYGDVYVVRDVPVSAYQLPPVATIAVPNFLVVPRQMADDLAFDLARMLLERRDVLARAHPAAENLDVRSAVATLPVPLHPGAAEYFKSVKP
ncbi:TAXI family TRAP transporter solute-binding subunit [Phytohabitans flavus]|uniref:C4-dicarboxylate ABC transporter substrate-binding protein n=2 Tax=Phytohabitans flavus TaxID=1076124 RepID=A0A6F8XTC4_9ACTN|nr:TAXI family TRAP transporter solute-binding subunit [Phytohabitans flavus]BCB77001.1 C4-dicarboxylate ABC transporter substrate-binding protein [Phytohabitans flavus]